MKKRENWTITELLIAGSLGVLTVVITLPASALVAFTGVPLMGGFVNIFLDRTLDALVLFLIPKFGAATVKRTVLGIVALPTLFLGPPGFLAKIVISGLNGLVIDTAFYLLDQKDKRLASVVSNALGAMFLGFSFVFIARVFQVPGIEETARVFLSPLLIVGAGLGGAISGYAGYLIYKKIETTALVRRIQA